MTDPLVTVIAILEALSTSKDLLKELAPRSERLSDQIYSIEQEISQNVIRLKTRQQSSLVHRGLSPSSTTPNWGRRESRTVQHLLGKILEESNSLESMLLELPKRGSSTSWQYLIDKDRVSYPYLEGKAGSRARHIDASVHGCASTPIPCSAIGALSSCYALNPPE